MTTTSETATYLYETTVDLHRRGSVEHQQRALCVQYEDAAAKVTVTYMGETGLGTQLNINIPASEVPVMGRALYAAAGLLNPVAQMERLREENAKLRDERDRAYSALSDYGRSATDVSGDLEDGINAERLMVRAEGRD